MNQYIAYRIAAWRFVNWVIQQAEEANQVFLDEDTRRKAKGVVINRLIEEVTELPVDLIAETIPAQESVEALDRLFEFRQRYQTCLQ